MNKAGSPTLRSSEQGRVPDLGDIVQIVFECAIEVLIKTYVVLLVGGIALGIAGGVWRQMTPSHPPGFSPQPELETVSPGWIGSVGASISAHRFTAVYLVLLAVTVWGRMCKAPLRQFKVGSRVQRMAGRLSENWFGLIVGNVFGAMIAAIVFSYVQRFMPMRMLLNGLISSVLDTLQSVAQQLFGATSGHGVKSWFEWYGENSFKFSFWVFYLGAICDDLGIPNFKSLGRWIGRKIRHRKQQAQASEAKPPLLNP